MDPHLVIQRTNLLTQCLWWCLCRWWWFQTKWWWTPLTLQLSWILTPLPKIRIGISTCSAILLRILWITTTKSSTSKLEILVTTELRSMRSTQEEMGTGKILANSGFKVVTKSLLITRGRDMNLRKRILTQSLKGSFGLSKILNSTPFPELKLGKLSRSRLWLEEPTWGRKSFHREYTFIKVL